MLLDVDYTAQLADFGYASLVGNIHEALAYLERSTVRPGALRWSARRARTTGISRGREVQLKNKKRYIFLWLRCPAGKFKFVGQILDGC